MILMAAGTLMIGLIRSYATIGFWAPRAAPRRPLRAGFSTGGEYGGAATFIAEYSPDKRRGFMGSWLEFGTLAGYVLGASIVTVLHYAMPETPCSAGAGASRFMIAGPLGLIGLYLRA